MNKSIEPKDGALPTTRQTLLARIKDMQDADSWQRFFDTYANLIYSIALKAGLTASEAQDALQETMITLQKNIVKFEYDPAKGKFRSWLLRLARWRIYDQFRKRPPGAAKCPHPGDTATQTTTIGRISDPHGCELERIWNQEWNRELFNKATALVQEAVDPFQFSIFELNFLKERPAEEVATTLGVPIDAVYRAKHRTLVLIKKELARLKDALV